MEIFKNRINTELDIPKNISDRHPIRVMGEKIFFSLTGNADYQWDSCPVNSEMAYDDVKGWKIVSTTLFHTLLEDIPVSLHSTLKEQEETKEEKEKEKEKKVFILTKENWILFTPGVNLEYSNGYWNILPESLGDI